MDRYKNIAFIKLDRYEYLVKEGTKLYKKGDLINAQKKIDTYIKNVLYPHKSSTVKLYSNILYKLGIKSLSLIYKSYYSIYKHNFPKKETQDYIQYIIHIDESELDSNIVWWKHDLLIKYGKKCYGKGFYQGRDNDLFLLLQYNAQHIKEVILPKNTKKIILESNHKFKPIMIYLYTDLCERRGGNLKKYQNILYEILKYENDQLFSQRYFSTYSYAYFYLGGIENDIFKKFTYQCDSLKCGLIYNEPDYVLDVKRSHLKESIINILDEERIFLDQHYLELGKLLSKKWKIFIESIIQKSKQNNTKNIQNILDMVDEILNIKGIKKKKIERIYSNYFLQVNHMSLSQHKKLLLSIDTHGFKFNISHIDIKKSSLSVLVSFIFYYVRIFTQKVRQYIIQIFFALTLKSNIVLLLSLSIFFLILFFILFIIFHIA